MNKRKLLISILGAIAGMLFLSFLCLAILVKKNWLFEIDSWAIKNFSSIRSDGLTTFVNIFSYLGSVIVLIPVAVLMMIFVKEKRAKIFIAIALASAGVVSTIMKYIVQRPRPVDIALIEEVGYSFPSAHTMLSLVLYGFLIYLILKFMRNKPLKVILSILLLVVIIAVALTRVYLGVHFMTDICGGWLLGECVLVIILTLYEFAFRKNHVSQRVK